MLVRRLQSQKLNPGRFGIKPPVYIYDPPASLDALSAHPKTTEVDSKDTLGALSARSKTPKLEIKSQTFSYKTACIDRYMIKKPLWVHLVLV